MKFCFIIPSLEGGGAQRVVLTFTKELLARGHEVTIILFDGSAAYSPPAGAKVIVLRKGDLRGGWLHKRILAFLLRRTFEGLQKQGKFDFAASSLPFADEVVRLSRLTGIWRHVHNTLSQEIAGLEIRGARQKAERRTNRYRKLYSGQNIIAVSKGVADDLIDNIGVGRSRIEVVYNPFKFEEILRRSDEDNRNIPQEPYLLHAGRVVRQKRHDILLDAFKLSGVPHKLVLLSEPSEKLTGMIAERGLGTRVIVAGFQSNPYPWYKRAAALVLSSDFEGFGNVLVEALICGTPAVSTNCASGPNEILTGPLAEFLSPPGDASALAANILKAVKNPPTISSEALMRFSAENTTRGLEKLASEAERN